MKTITKITTFIAASGSRGAHRTVVTIIAASLAFSCNTAAAIDIVLHATASPASRTVRLGDVATIQNADGHLAKRLANLPLMPAPAEGATHELTARDVRDFIAVLGEDVADLRFLGAQRVTIGLGGGSHVPYTAPATVTTHRQPVVISRKRREELVSGLEKLLVTHIAQRSGDEGPWELEIQLTEPMIQELARAETRPHVVGGEAPWSGEQQFLVDFLDDHGEVRLPIVANVSRQEAVIVAKQAIDADRLITRAVIEMKYVSSKDRRTTRREVANSLDDVLGRVTTRALRAGDVLYLDQLRAPLFVRRGETVQAFARGGGIEVRTYAKARNDGLPGDLIEIEPLHSKERIYAKVVGQGQVEVYASGASGTVARRQPERTARVPQAR